MAEETRWALAEDIFAALPHGEVAQGTERFTVERVDDGTVLAVDLGEPNLVYVVTVASVPREL